MIRQILSILFIFTVIVIIISSYLEVPIIENMNNSSERELGKLDEKVNVLDKKVKDLLHVVKMTEKDNTINQYPLLKKMASEIKENKENINKMAGDSPAAGVAKSANGN